MYSRSPQSGCWMISQVATRGGRCAESLPGGVLLEGRGSGRCRKPVAQVARAWRSGRRVSAPVPSSGTQAKSWPGATGGAARPRPRLAQRPALCERCHVNFSTTARAASGDRIPIPASCDLRAPSQSTRACWPSRSFRSSAGGTAPKGRCPEFRAWTLIARGGCRACTWFDI
jgi:hypothetical protein